jgi:hypothetical protein
MSKVPQSLFKYRTLNADNLDAIRNNYIWLSCPSTFNDPFDTLHYIDPNIKLDGDPNKHEKKKSQIIKAIRSELVYCMAEQHNNRLMWAHYSDSHKGFSIEYDVTDTHKYYEKNNPFGFLKLVYAENPLNIPDYLFSLDFYDSGKLKKIGTNLELMTTKDKVWKYENEWRIIESNAISEDAPKGKRLIISNIKLKIKAIYLGAATHNLNPTEQILLNELISIANTRGIALYQMETEHNKYELIAKPYKG